MEQQNSTNELLGQFQDSVPDSIHPFLNFLLENAKLILGIVAAIIIIAAGYAIMQHSQQKALDQAASQLGAIMIQYHGADQIKQLEKFQTEAPSEMKNSVDLALARAYMDASQFDKAAAAWKDIAAKKDTFSSIAVIGQAKSLILGDKPDEAISLLQGLQSKTGETYKATINRLLASAAVMSGNNELAIQAYQALMTDNPTERMYYESKVAELKAKH
ncbi:tetratricopeptide repeat protein [Maridesulfovibrio bastinii]|jgi:predicted negative regulator of RcsB-dependent stress response|uniref:tetratricopeptide repeat protein n=1 Tax=Maridesulfovibrio bastinii TaxID=47157 RepID=UPI0004197C59|nr:tetratricopeptide repeat protein [Maridesulfovibrio bastinii]